MILRALRSCYSVLLLLAAWELFARSGMVPRTLLPPVSLVLQRTAIALATDTFVADLATTLFRLLAGLALAVGLGIALGVISAQTRAGRAIFEPLVRVLGPLPKIALFPVLLLTLGFDNTPRIVLVLIDAIFPVMLAAHYAARAVDEKLIWSARAAGTSPTGCVLRVILPAAMPQILTGIRVAAVIACVVVFLSEMVQPGDGLGDQMIRAARAFRSVDMFVPIVVISGLGFILDTLLALVRRRALGWAG
ncbi:ABC transporter permease [Limobrevibacterium gyesilva]|uniref:ABC transporter permease n=1 Tax=Limobrevibacterium gyesilva TaxID=2991712 RepID=A0AA41YU64_9PROT|nr:ABC transporter permease [Limobrevibacterium gyesilva]MCW3475482.1 ABC transporter permease [Limobrevibacterium gyesilva]